MQEREKKKNAPLLEPLAQDQLDRHAYAVRIAGHHDCKEVLAEKIRRSSANGREENGTKTNRDTSVGEGTHKGEAARTIGVQSDVGEHAGLAGARRAGVDDKRLRGQPAAGAATLQPGVRGGLSRGWRRR